MSRMQKLLLNTFVGITKQVIIVVSGFILPRYMLVTYGSNVNGLVNSVTHFLSFISMLEMGVGAVVQSNLYKPLAEKDSKQISRLVLSSERFFRRIGMIFLVYLIALCICFPLLVSREFDHLFTCSLLIIIAISMFAQYFLGITYQILLEADQKGYVQSLIQCVVIILNTLLCVWLMKLGHGVHVVKLASSLIFVLQPFILQFYVRTHYNLDRKIVLEGEPIKQKWNGFAQHMAANVRDHTDVVVLTAFSALQNVSVYSVYHAVCNGVTQIVMMGASGIEPLFGNIIATNEKDKLKQVFETTEWVVHTVVTILFAILFITLLPFITVYTADVTDVNYMLPAFAVLMVLAYGWQCLRIPYYRMIKAAGHYKQTQNGAHLSMIINVVLSVGLVFKFDLYGVIFGTLASFMYHTCYSVWYLRKNIIYRPLRYFLLYLCTDVLTVAIAWLICRNIRLMEVTFLSWIILAIEAGIVVLVVSAIVNAVFYHKKLCRLFTRKKS